MLPHSFFVLAISIDTVAVVRYPAFMPRTARIVIPGAAHHATQRGNNKQVIFLDDEDRLKYLDLLRHYSVEFHLRIVAYCLMTNHIHLVAVPGFKTSLADAIGRTHQQYTSYFHDKQNLIGHLWQSRFFSCPMDTS
ncbi:MAG: transposase, partial [Candidatus Hydrogenedentes bacterium]|nr:transposase [Candidatus Hydrogenedentota bacterium]